jgi:hypothetical protein
MIGPFVSLFQSGYLLPRRQQRSIAVTKDNGRQGRSGRLVDAADFRDRLIQLVLGQKLDLVGGPPAADAGS